MPAAWTLALYTLVLAALILPLLPALIELRRRADAEPLQVVRQQDVNVRLFAYSFRNQLMALFAKYRIDPVRPPGSFEGFWKEGERFQFVGPGQAFRATERELAAGAVKRLIVSCTELLLPGDIVYEQEVFAGGSILTREATTFRALYSETNISFAEDCTVARWAHADKRIFTNKGCRLYGRCSSNDRIILLAGTEFERLNAPVILTGESLAVPAPPPPLRTLQPFSLPRGAMELDAKTYLHDGALTVPERHSVNHSIISTDVMKLGRQSLVEGSIKAYRFLEIGSGSVVRGAVVCGGDIAIGAGCIIAGPIIAEGSVSVGRGCLVGSRTAETSVSAPDIRLVEGSRYCGSLWAGRRGKVSHAPH